MIIINIKGQTFELCKNININNHLIQYQSINKIYSISFEEHVIIYLESK
jgi:hypothetical protein